MQIIQSRRDFLAGLSAAATTAALGSGTALAEDGPPETTTIRIRFEVAPNLVNGVVDNMSCTAPLYLSDGLLRAEGFTDLRYVPMKGGMPVTEAFTRGEIDFSTMFVPGAVRRLDAGVPITVLAGMHPGCLNLFVQDSIRTFTDLKGRQVGIDDGLGSVPQLYVSIMAAHVGLDPEKDIEWVTTDDVPRPIELFVHGKIDAFMPFVSNFPELRERKIGRVLVDMAMDRPWSQYFCCIIVGHTEFVRNYPVATKRALRAILKATDACATAPDRAARQLVDAGFTENYDIALQVLNDLPYNAWRELDPEDSLRFYSLWLHEFGMIDATPNQLIAQGTDWRFLNELKRELKA